MANDPFSQQYPFAQSSNGPSLSGVQTGPSTLSGLQQGTAGGQIEGRSPFAPNQGQLLSTLFQSLSPNQQLGPGKTLTTTLNPIISSLNPNLLGMFGSAPATPTPLQQPSLFGMASRQSEVGLNQLLDQLKLASGQPSTAEELQVASNRLPGETTQQTAERMQLNPLGGSFAGNLFNPLSLLSLGQNIGNVSAGAQALTSPNAPPLTSFGGASQALGTGGSLLQLLSAIPGLNPAAAQGLGIGGQASKLTGGAIAPATLGAFGLANQLTPLVSTPQVAGGSIGGGPPIPATNALASGAGIAGGLLGLGGSVAGALGQPGLGTGLNLGSAGLGLASALSNPATLAAFQGALPNAALGSTLASTGAVAPVSAVLGPMVAAGVAIKTLGDLRSASIDKKFAGQAAQSQQALQAMLPQLQTAAQNFQTSRPTEADFQTILNGIRHIDDVFMLGEGIKGLKLGGGLPEFQQQLFGLLRTNPELYTRAFVELAKQPGGQPGGAINPQAARFSPYAQFVQGPSGFRTGRLPIPPPPSPADLPQVNIPSESGRQWSVLPPNYDIFHQFRPAGFQYIDASGRPVKTPW